MEAVRKNPLGIYVHAFNWSQDVATSRRRQMRMPRAFGWLTATAITVAACATTVRVPEILILDGIPFKEAIREAEPKPSVKGSSRCQSPCRCRVS